MVWIIVRIDPYRYLYIATTHRCQSTTLSSVSRYRTPHLLHLYARDTYVTDVHVISVFVIDMYVLSVYVLSVYVVSVYVFNV